MRSLLLGLVVVMGSGCAGGVATPTQAATTAPAASAGHAENLPCCGCAPGSSRAAMLMRAAHAAPSSADAAATGTSVAAPTGALAAP